MCWGVFFNEYCVNPERISYFPRVVARTTNGYLRVPAVARGYFRSLNSDWLTYGRSWVCMGTVCTSKPCVHMGHAERSNPLLYRHHMVTKAHKGCDSSRRAPFIVLCWKQRQTHAAPQRPAACVVERFAVQHTASCSRTTEGCE